MTAEPPSLSDIRACFEGIIPATIATVDAEGVPNVTHLSRVHFVDDERVALSNQFFSKTTRNLAVNPYASVELIDPATLARYHLRVRYERTERRGPLFERMRHDIDAVAALTGMSGVFKLRSADVYRVDELVQVRPAVEADEPAALGEG
jgi:adenylate cyclase